MTKRLCLAVAIVAIVVAVSLAGAARDMKHTTTVIERESWSWEIVDRPLAFPIMVTPTRVPYRHLTPTPGIDYVPPTRTPIRDASGIVQVR